MFEDVDSYSYIDVFFLNVDFILYVKFLFWISLIICIVEKNLFCNWV